METITPFRILPKTAGSPRSTDRPVVLVGFLQQGNLGLGYLSATLRKSGYTVQVIDFESEP